MTEEGPRPETVPLTRTRLRNALDGALLIAVAIGIVALPISCAWCLEQSKKPHTARERCAANTRSEQWCFEASEILNRTHGTCGERKGNCEATRASYARLAPHATLSSCQPTNEVWSVEYFDLGDHHTVRRHWSPDERECTAYRTLLTELSPRANPGACVHTEEARMRSCLALELEGARRARGH